MQVFFSFFLAWLLLAILKHNPLQSKGLRMSNGRRGGRQGLDVKKKITFFWEVDRGRPRPTCQVFFIIISNYLLPLRAERTARTMQDQMQ